MIQISYVSRTTEPMDGEQLLQLLLQCRTNNRASDITGMLLYGNGTFLQVLEGEDEVVDKLAETISKDPRHADVEFLSRREIEHRDYADWGMGFRRMTDENLEEVEGLKGFEIDQFTFDYLTGHRPVIHKLMEHYREPHYDQVFGELDAKDKVIEHLRGALSKVGDRAQIARLALESITEACRHGAPSESLLKLCDSALRSFRPAP